ncbi:MAG TPA: LON peptidase substrate-binding domain-containing protein, partial [Polyangiaceae bacterium]|nr:LON peptidase substrate-binding domain-containing protein [Polyangiaceae bacterium]
MEFAEDLPLLTPSDTVVFPGSLFQIELRSAALAEHLASHPDATLAVFTRKDAKTEGVSREALHDVGVVAQVVSLGKQPGGGLLAVVRGIERATLESVAEGEVPMAKVARVPAPVAPDVSAPSDHELDALLLSLREAVHVVMEQLRVPAELFAQVDAIASAGELADFIAGRMEATPSEKAEILATLDVKTRVRDVLTRVVRRGEVLKIRKSIDAQIQHDMGKKQREHILREQMRAIERELAEDGEGDDESDVDGLEKRVEEASLSPEAREVAEKQLKRLRNLQTGSPEFGTIRTYLEWIVDLPWTQSTPDSPDIAAVRAVLDADHYGLEKVKRRILEFLAVRKLNGHKKSPILCLIGPPGVGKTSL